MTPEEFVNFAGQLAARPNAGAAIYRTAISRAYYGEYHQVREFFELDLQIPCNAGGSEHALLIKLLYNANVAEAHDLSLKLGNLLDYRKSADYELNDAGVEAQPIAKVCVESGASILSTIQLWKQTPLAESIKVGVLAYKKLTNS